MADIAIFRINYKSDFILTLQSDAGWTTPFCIKFWTGAPSQAYFAGYDGTTYTNCAPVEGEPTKLLVQFDDHHLPIGDLKFQIGYHFTVADFPTSVEDEVINQSAVIIDNDGERQQVMLDLNGETAPEIEFSLPAYANEAQRIANEQQRIANEQTRIANEEARIAAETIRQQNEEQRIEHETARVDEFAQLKRDSEQATSDANTAANLANEKAQLAADKAALAQAAATLANEKAQLASDKAALANAAAQLANEKAALAQQKAEYAQQQGGYAKDQGDYAKNKGDYAKEQGDTALADHQRAEADHGIAVDDHTQAGNDHTRAESDHSIAADDHSRAEADHTTASSDHSRAESDHITAASDHTRAESDHTTAASDHETAASDHTRAESDHAAVEVYVDSLGVFDLSKHNAVDGVLATYADLSAALTALNAIDSKYKYGGMSFKFVQSSDNKYVKFFCTADEFTTDVTKWQGVDDTPTAGSDNLVKSGGVAEEISKLPSVVESETDFSIEDKNGNAIIELYEGHLHTKEFDSKIVQEDIVNANEQIENLKTKITPIVDNGVEGLLFSDEEGNVVGGWKGGHEVSKYPSAYTTDADGALNIEDSKGNKILSLNDGHIKTKNFSSKELMEKVNDIIENGTKKKISILFVGNSMTQDAISYLPYLLKEIAPDVEFKFYIYFTGGFTLAQQYENFINEWYPGTFSICENVISWTNHASWEASSIKQSMKAWLQEINFDILCLQDYFSVQPTTDNAVTDFNNCVNYIRNNYSGQFKVVNLFHRPRTNVFDEHGPQSTLECFNMIKTAAELYMKNTACQSVMTPGVAAYFATLDPILQPLGDIENLTPDGSHAQDTLGCLLQAYTVALWLFNEIGLPYGIYNNHIRINQTLFNAINPPGPNVGSGIIVGTDTENNEAQLVAVKAFKYGQSLINNSLV